MPVACGHVAALDEDEFRSDSAVYDVVRVEVLNAFDELHEVFERTVGPQVADSL